MSSDKNTDCSSVLKSTEAEASPSLRLRQKFPYPCGNHEHRILLECFPEFLRAIPDLLIVFLQDDDLNRVFLLTLVKPIRPNDRASFESVPLSYDSLDIGIIFRFESAGFSGIAPQGGPGAKNDEVLR